MLRVLNDPSCDVAMEAPGTMIRMKHSIAKQVKPSLQKPVGNDAVACIVPKRIVYSEPAIS